MAEPYIIKMPQLSDTMTEGTVVSWEKNIGDFIERGTVVATVETDKAIMDVEVFREGYLSGPLAAEGAVVPTAVLPVERLQTISTMRFRSSLKRIERRKRIYIGGIAAGCRHITAQVALSRVWL